MPIFGNGDIDSPEKALEYKNKYGVDGIMIGRASIGYPWIFNEIKHFMKTGEHLPKPTIENRVEVCLTHFKKSIEWKGPKLGVFEMRPHYTNYFRGISHFKDTRMKLVTTDSINEIEDLLLAIPEKFAELV